MINFSALKCPASPFLHEKTLCGHLITSSHRINTIYCYVTVLSGNTSRQTYDKKRMEIYNKLWLKGQIRDDRILRIDSKIEN